MRKISLAMFALSIIGLACQPGKPIPTEITFRTDFESAREEALKSQKPMIIDFCADTAWSQYCRQLNDETFSDSLVIAMSNDDIFVKINAETDTALAFRFAISGYPTIVVTKPDGTEIDRILGFVDANEFYNQVNLYLMGKETLEDYLTRLEDEPENPEYLMTIAEKYTGRAQPDKAVEFYNRLIALDSDNLRGYASKALAGIYQAQGISKDYESAIATCQGLIRRFPASPEAEDADAMMGYFTALSGKPDSALVIYRNYLQKYPDGRNSWVRDRLADLEEKL
jgi:tetratricopeptide (TPR) repeat protein